MKKYLINCVGSTAELIGNMVDNATEIEYSELLEHVTQEELDRVFPFYLDVPNLNLEKDYTTSFWKGEYDGQPCVYVEHSRIEYVFV